MAGDVGGRSCTDAELLLHPELLSQEFLLLTLEQVGRSGPTEHGRAAGRTGRPAGGSWPLPAHTEPVGLLTSLGSPPKRKRRKSGWHPRKILTSSERASQTTPAASVQATACGREGLGRTDREGRSLVQSGLDPEQLRKNLLHSFFASLREPETESRRDGLTS